MFIIVCTVAKRCIREHFAEKNMTDKSLKAVIQFCCFVTAVFWMFGFVSRIWQKTSQQISTKVGWSLSTELTPLTFWWRDDQNFNLEKSGMCS